MNFSKTEVTGVHAPAALAGFEDVLLSERERLFIEQGGPRRKATLDFDYTWGKLETDFRIVHFGPQTLGTFSGPPVPNQHYEVEDLGRPGVHLVVQREDQADRGRHEYLQRASDGAGSERDG
jgi:hypothetical protein